MANFFWIGIITILSLVFIYFAVTYIISVYSSLVTAPSSLTATSSIPAV